MDYFDCPIRIQERDGWLIWYSDREDGVLMDEQKRILVFASVDALEWHATRNGIRASRSQSKRVDFDSPFSEFAAPQDCDRALCMWNLDEDMERSLGVLKPVESGVSVSAYDKLFHGNNLPAVNQSGNAYIPTFSGEELAEIQSIQARGLRILKTQSIWK